MTEDSSAQLQADAISDADNELFSTSPTSSVSSFSVELTLNYEISLVIVDGFMWSYYSVYYAYASIAGCGCRFWVRIRIP